jgi:glycosyltransferase involved in cell wall biosynthesis
MPTVVSMFGVKPSRIGGTETFARELSLQLGNRGWKSVLCFPNEPRDQVRKFLTLPNTTLEVVEDQTVDSWRAGRTLSQILKRHRPEILHLHFTGFLTGYPWLARTRSVRSVFLTDHTSRPAGFVPRRAPLAKRLATRVINSPLTKVICVSRFGYESLTALDVLPKERFQLIYNAVDLTRVKTDELIGPEFRRRYSIPDERKIVAQVSWMIPQKGIPELLEAARLVLDQRSDVQFVLVGEGSYREQFMDKARYLGLGDHITWTGLVENPFDEGVFQAADIVCQLSQWEELFGWMIAEAMAHRKPIVATRVGGIPELVSDGQSGFLVDRGDVAAVADRLLKLLANEKLCKNMGEAGQRLVQEKFDLQKNVAQLIDTYGI